MDLQHNGAAPERVDFSKIKTSIPIPNLIEVQKKSYERFLQMDLLPNEREDIGLQTVFNSVFPISDFRGVSDLEFVDYSIGNWECKCGNLKGLHHLRSTCRNCGATIRTDPFHAGDILCNHCGTFNKNVVTFCNKCGDPVGLQLKYDMLECQERGMTYAAPLKVTIRLTVYSKDPITQLGRQSIIELEGYIDRLRAELEDESPGAWCKQEWPGNGRCEGLENTITYHSLEDCGELKRKVDAVEAVPSEPPPPLLTDCPEGMVRTSDGECRRKLRGTPASSSTPPKSNGPSTCGNNTCDAGENSESCCQDCGCPESRVCRPDGAGGFKCIRGLKGMTGR